MGYLEYLTNKIIKYQSLFFILTPLVYIVGFVVSNLYLTKYNLASYDLISPRYLAIGFVTFVFITPIVSLIYFVSLNLHSFNLYNEDSKFSKLLRHNLYFNSALVVISLFFTLFWLLLITSLSLGSLRSINNVPLLYQHIISVYKSNLFVIINAWKQTFGAFALIFIANSTVYSFISSLILGKSIKQILRSNLQNLLTSISRSVYTLTAFFIFYKLGSKIIHGNLDSQSISIYIFSIIVLNGVLLILMFSYKEDSLFDAFVPAESKVDAKRKARSNGYISAFLSLNLILFSFIIFPLIPYGFGGGMSRRLEEIKLKEDETTIDNSKSNFVIEESSKYIYIQTEKEGKKIIKQIPSDSIKSITYLNN